MKNWKGDFKDTDEMIEISWHDKNDLPYDNMLAADKIFVEKIMRGEKFSAQLKYSEDMKEVIGEPIFSELKLN